MIHLFGRYILTKGEYEELVQKIDILDNARGSLNRKLNKMGEKKMIIMKGRYGSLDLLPLHDALDLMVKRFREDAVKKINPSIDIELHPDGVTRDITLKFEYYDVTKREGK